MFGPFFYWGPIGVVKDAGPHLLEIADPRGGSPFLCQKRLTVWDPARFIATGYQKHITYMEQKGRKLITQIESRAVDMVLFDKNKAAYYAIKRKDSGKIALPGGFIDPADGIGTLPLSDITANAAKRECTEETGHTPTTVLLLGHEIREHIRPDLQSKVREWITFTWPCAAPLTMRALTPADDADPAPGHAGNIAGWYNLAGPHPDFHFLHHLRILERLKQFVRDQKTYFPHEQRSTRGSIRKGFAQLQSRARATVLNDYKRILAGKEPFFSVANKLTPDDINALKKRWKSNGVYK